MKKTLKMLSVIAILLIGFSMVQAGYAQDEDTSAGTAHIVSAVPQITSPELWNAAEDTDANNTALTVNTEYHLNFTVSDSNNMGDLDNVTIRIWDSTTKTENQSDAQVDHYSFTWVEFTNTWSCVGPGASYIVDANCQDPGTGGSGTTYEFTLAFKLSKVAAYVATTTTWKISIFVWDDGDSADSEKTLMCGVAFFTDIVITDTTHEWSGLTPGSSDNVTLDGDHDVDFTVLSNAAFDVEAKGSGALTKGGDTIPLSNVRIHKDTLTSSASLTTDYVDVGGLTDQSAGTAEASPTSLATMLWITVPGGTPSGDYTYTLSLKATKH